MKAYVYNRTLIIFVGIIALMIGGMSLLSQLSAKNKGELVTFECISDYDAPQNFETHFIFKVITEDSQYFNDEITIKESGKSEGGRFWRKGQTIQTYYDGLHRYDSKQVIGGMLGIGMGVICLLLGIFGEDPNKK